MEHPTNLEELCSRRYAGGNPDRRSVPSEALWPGQQAPMRLLDFARGPALHWALVIMVAGSVWRTIHFAFRRRDQDVYWARKGLHVPNQRWQIDSYVMHAGLLVVMFGFAPHILFIGALTGITWPSMPTVIVLAAAVVSIGSMFAVLIRRLTASEPSLFSVFN